MTSRKLTATDLCLKFGCKQYLTSFSVAAYRITAADAGDGSFWVIAEDAAGVVGMSPYASAMAALDAASELLTAKQATEKGGN